MDKQSVTWENFKGGINKLGGVTLEPEWLGAEVAHRIICPLGHSITCRPITLQKERRLFCNLCSLDFVIIGSKVEAYSVKEEVSLSSIIRRQNVVEQKTRLPRTLKEDFYYLVSKQGGAVLEAKWLGNYSFHAVRCANGHTNLIKPINLSTEKDICRSCTARAFDAFYVLSNPALLRIKFGITHGNARARLNAHKTEGFSCIERLLVKLPGGVASTLERLCLSVLDDAKWTPVRGREYFDIAALPTVLDIVDNYPITG